jgi:serine protease Do
MTRGVHRLLGRIGMAASLLLMLPVASLWPVSPAFAADLVDTVARIKPSIVGVATHQALRSPRTRLLGTGFVVADGNHVITSEHVLPEALDSEANEFLVIAVVGEGGREGEVRKAERVLVDVARDLALLRFEGDPLPALVLGEAAPVREGREIAFIGFPIGTRLGLVPATHRGIVSAITRIVMPPRAAREITPATARRLRDPFEIYQLDATAYPGNSGSPLFEPESGAVLGVVNMVFVQEGGEPISRPSGISYAIPVRYVRHLLAQAELLSQ